jgi:hypothetical protein
VSLAGHDAQYLHAVWLVASLCGVAVLASLAAVYRRASRRAEAEEVERILEEDEASNHRPHHVSSRHGRPDPRGDPSDT